MLHRGLDGALRWWTWAGVAANWTSHASLTGFVDPAQQAVDEQLCLHADAEWGSAATRLRVTSSDTLRARPVDDRVDGSKVSAACSTDPVRSTVAERLGDPVAAVPALGERRLIRPTGADR